MRVLARIHGEVEVGRREETDLGVGESLLLLCGLVRPSGEGRGGRGRRVGLDVVSVLTGDGVAGGGDVDKSDRVDSVRPRWWNV